MRRLHDSQPINRLLKVLLTRLSLFYELLKIVNKGDKRLKMYYYMNADLYNFSVRLSNVKAMELL